MKIGARWRRINRSLPRKDFYVSCFISFYIKKVWFNDKNLLEIINFHLLLAHQKAKPAYVNPTPWQRIIDDTEDVEEDAFNVGRKTQSQLKISSKRNATSFQWLKSSYNWNLGNLYGLKNDHMVKYFYCLEVK